MKQVSLPEVYSGRDFTLDSSKREHAETGGEAWRETVPDIWMTREPSDI